MKIDCCKNGNTLFDIDLGKFRLDRFSDNECILSETTILSIGCLFDEIESEYGGKF